MGDVKDILGVSRGAAPPAEKPEKAKGPRLVKPKGMSREAFALLSASHPLAPAELMEALVKGAAKAGGAAAAAAGAPRRRGQVAYRWLPFDNPARADGLQLSHWVKCYLDPATGAPAPAEAGHAFAKYAKGAPALRYDDEEWAALIAPDPSWSRAETDYLLDLVERLDARWLAVADRYDFAVEGGSAGAAGGAAGAGAGAGAGAAGGSGADGAAAGAAAADGAPARRDLEDLKARYYAVARQLVVGRAGGPEGVANHALVKHPFSAERERQRKRGLELLLARAPAEDAAEDAVLAEAAKVEAKRRAEAGARGRGGGGGGGGGLGGGKDAAAAAAVAAVEVPEVAAEPPVGTPPLFDARGEPAPPAAPAEGVPPPRVVARAAAVREIVDAALAAGDPADRQQRALLGALAELKMAELPRAATRQVCGAYLALLREVAEHLALKRELATRQALAAAGGGAKREAREEGEGGEEGGDEPAGKRQRTARRAYDD